MARLPGITGSQGAVRFNRAADIGSAGYSEGLVCVLPVRAAAGPASEQS